MSKKITSFFGILFIFPMVAGLFCPALPCMALAEENGLDRELEFPHQSEIIVKYYGIDELKYIRFEEDELREKLEYFRSLEDVEYAELNYLYDASIIPSDTFYSNQWYLQKIKAKDAWDYVRESANIVIAIIDSGVQISHPDLADNIWRNSGEIPGNNIDDDHNGYIDDLNGWDFVNNSSQPTVKFNDGYTLDGVLHGTIVAGVAAASGNNGIGVSGITWNARIMALKALDDQGSGDSKNVVRAIDYAVANGADIINLSFVGHGFSQSLQNAIRNAYQSGVLVVAAAGNEQGQGNGIDIDNEPIYPACMDGNTGENMVIGVSATDALDQKANFSGYGSKCVDISAPGVSIFSTSVYAPDKEVDGKVLNNYYDGYWAGTSMATPMISGALALVTAANPSLSPAEVRDSLLSTADSIERLNPEYHGMLGTGRVNVLQAVTRARTLLENRKVELILSPYQDRNGVVDLTDSKGDKIKEFSAYTENYKNGISTASGDVDGDGKDEIVTGTGNGGGPQVRVFNADGEPKGQFFAYAENFRGGVNVAVGDIDGDGVDEIVTGAGNGGGPHIRIFNDRGDLMGQFFAYDKNFRGGVNVAVGDIDGDGVDEIVTGAGNGGGPQVRIFDRHGNVEGQFFAYDKNFRGGVRVAVGRLSRGSGNSMNIITAPGQGGGPHIIVYDNHARAISQFFAYSEQFHGGVSIAAADIDSDGLEEIITGAGPGGTPHVRCFETNGQLLESFYAWPPDFTGGVNVSAITLSAG